MARQSCGNSVAVPTKLLLVVSWLAASWHVLLEVLQSLSLMLLLLPSRRAV